MDTRHVKSVLASAKAIQVDARNSGLALPADEGLPARSEMVLPKSLTRNTRGYIEKVANQINGAYENGLYDACLVMIRRLLETLIIEVFEHRGIDNKIKHPTSGEFFYLADLITATLTETSWNLSRNTKRALPRLKDVGDLSAHNRRFNAHRTDIDNFQQDLRVVAQELLSLAGLK